jgi:hypothetical protein
MSAMLESFPTQKFRLHHFPKASIALSSLRADSLLIKVMPSMSRLLPVVSLLVASLLVLGFLVSLHAVASEDGTSTLQPWKPEDFIYAESVPEYSLSPDGGSLVWIKSMGDKEKDARV